MSHLSRRRFLEDSMMAAAAAAAVSAKPVWSAETTSEGKGANERLSVAVIGVNGRGQSHLGAFSSREDTEVTHICDADEAIGMKRVESVGKKQGRAPKYVRDMREIFDDPSIDIVTTATPNHWHSLCAIWAVQAGKDVYLEKPVSHNVSEGRRVVEAARKYGRIVQTGTQCRSMPGTIDAVKYVHDGKIGDLLVARGLCYKSRGSIGPKGDYPVPASVDYDLWLGPAPKKSVSRSKFHYDWHWQWDYGNGDLGNQGIHQMDIARWGLGVDALSEAVYSYGGRFGYEDAGETANTQMIVHEYPNGKKLVFEVRGLKTDDLRGAKVGVIFEGTEGYVVLTDYTSGAAFDLDGKMITKFNGEADHFDNFVKAVRSRKVDDLNADILEGHLSSALCHTGNISYRLGSHISFDAAKERMKDNEKAQASFERFCSHLADNDVDLATTELTFGERLAFDPKAEKFVNNSQADAMLSREYRAPFVVPAAGQV